MAIVRAAACASAGVALVAAGLGAMPALADAPAPHLRSVEDRLADVVDLTAASVTIPAADITGASLEYGAGWIRMQVKTFSFTDPVTEPDWQSGDTFAVWSMDTTGDGKTDYLVEYGVTGDKELYGDVLRPNAPPDDPAVCTADSVVYSSSAAGGVYELRVDPACLGHPSSIAFTVGLSYDSGAGRGAGPVGTDIVPDRGFAPAVPAPSPPASPTPVVGVAPQLLPTPTAAALSPPASGGSAIHPAPAVRPPVRLRKRLAGPTTAPTTSPAAAAFSPRPVAPQLPRTGPARLLPLSGVGFGMVLIGVGVLVMVSPRRPVIPV